MIRRINKLDKYTANKIAAGEVVDRPASVVKELVENSVDAGSSIITVEIKEGGKTYIRITDNGVGIHESDVEIAFERHATSKIKKVEDLNAILSLGFRGEALASIASVSQLELITKTNESEAGISLSLHGGKIVQRQEIGCPNGTTMVIKNLFFNTPARLQFMKSSSTETGYISDFLSKMALAYPNIAFRFINNGRIIFTTSGSGNTMNNIVSIYGKELIKNLYPISSDYELFSMEAYISKPSMCRGNKQQQVFFVNGRYIKSRMICSAIEKAYKTLVMVKKFPICFIFLKIKPENLDVNIHPTKLEIRFSQEQEMEKLIADVLKKKLLGENLIPNAHFDQEKKQETPGENQIPLTIPLLSKQVDKQTPFETIEEDKSKYIVNNKLERPPKNPPVRKEMVYQRDVPVPVVSVEKTNTTEVEHSQKIKDIKILGQIFNTYLLGNDGNTLYLIDQHAAHERIQYDWLVKKYRDQSILTQRLLVPMVIDLSVGDFQRAKKHIQVFNHLGYETEIFGDNAFIIRSVPVVFGEPEAKKFFIDIVDQLEDGIKNTYDMKIEKIISMACKKSIKAKDKLDPKEMEELMNQLSQLENPYTCPHGRPIIVSMSEYEIQKKFKRI